MKATVVTGFLGAGKTTLMRRLILALAARAEQESYLVIINDASGRNVDMSRVAQIRLEATPWVPLDLSFAAVSGGCLCCGSVAELTKLVHAARENDISHLLVETSGLTDAAEIEAVFIDQESLDLRVITLVDGENFDFPDKLGVLGNGVRYADLVGVTKTSELGLPIMAAIGRHNTGKTPVMLVDTENLFLEALWSVPFRSARIHEPHVCGHGCKHHHHHEEGVDEPKIHGVVVQTLDLHPMELVRFAAWLDNLVGLVKGLVIRLKGVYSGQGEVLDFDLVGDGPLVYTPRKTATSTTEENFIVMMTAKPLSGDALECLRDGTTITTKEDAMLSEKFEVAQISAEEATRRIDEIVARYPILPRVDGNWRVVFEEEDLLERLVRVPGLAEESVKKGIRTIVQFKFLAFQMLSLDFDSKVMWRVLSSLLWYFLNAEKYGVAVFSTFEETLLAAACKKWLLQSVPAAEEIDLEFCLELFAGIKLWKPELLDWRQIGALLEDWHSALAMEASDLASEGDSPAQVFEAAKKLLDFRRSLA